MTARDAKARADRAAVAMATYAGLLAHRVAHEPAQPVSQQECIAFEEMRDALRSLSDPAAGRAAPTTGD
jgi:hypothetical protein